MRKFLFQSVYLLISTCFIGLNIANAVVEPQNDKKEANKNVIEKASHKDSSNEDKEKIAPVMTKKEDLYRISATDFFEGQKDAKVTIIEYSSLNCPHCAAFHAEAYKKIKHDFIDKGLVKYVYRDFPLTRSALAASILVHCAGKDRYFDFLSSLFESQKVWAFNNNYIDSLLNIAKLGGIAEDKFRSCQDDKKLEEFILKRRMEATNLLGIEATPTFIINGEMMSGEISYERFKELINKYLKK